MKVKELIESLSKFNQDLEVCITDDTKEDSDGNQIFEPVNGIQEMKASNKRQKFLYIFHHEDF